MCEPALASAPIASGCTLQTVSFDAGDVVRGTESSRIQAAATIITKKDEAGSKESNLRIYVRGGPAAPSVFFKPLFSPSHAVLDNSLYLSVVPHIAIYLDWWSRKLSSLICRKIGIMPLKKENIDLLKFLLIQIEDFFPKLSAYPKQLASIIETTKDLNSTFKLILSQERESFELGTVATEPMVFKSEHTLEEGIRLEDISRETIFERDVACVECRAEWMRLRNNFLFSSDYLLDLIREFLSRYSDLSFSKEDGRSMTKINPFSFAPSTEDVLGEALKMNLTSDSAPIWLNDWQTQFRVGLEADNKTQIEALLKQMNIAIRHPIFVHAPLNSIHHTIKCLQDVLQPDFAFPAFRSSIQKSLLYYIQNLQRQLSASPSGVSSFLGRSEFLSEVVSSYELAIAGRRN